MRQLHSWKTIVVLGLGVLLVVAGGFAAASLMRQSPTARLIRQLQDPDDDVRQDAAKVLGEMGPEAKEAAGALTAALADTDDKVRYRAL